MSFYLDSTARLIKGRDKKHPLASSCPLHLRRVCGVCPHFEGDLRGSGVCQRTGEALRGNTEPGDCPDWSRRNAA